MDDAELVQRARRGDDRAFEMLVRRHERSLYATAYAITRSQWDASDAMQDALTEAYTKLRTLRDPAKFGAWTSRILVNKCNALLRRRGRTVLVEEPPEPQAYVLDGPEGALDLMGAIGALSLEHREVIALRYFRDLKVDDIAHLLGCPPGTVKSRINRAVAELGTALGCDYGAEVRHGVR